MVKMAWFLDSVMRLTKTRPRVRLLVAAAATTWFGCVAPWHTASGQVLTIQRKLDDDSVRGFVPDLSTGAFTVAIRVCFLGPGNRRGQDGVPGMVFFYGSGWFDGFRAAYDWNGHRFLFQIGRKEEQSAVQVVSIGPVHPWVMHDIVCAYDGKEMRLFVDGNEAGTTKVDGSIVRRNAPLTVGFGDFGLGSTRMYVDDLEFFPRNLTLDDVRKRFRTFPDRDRAHLEAMTSFMTARGAIDLGLTDNGYQLLLSNSAIPTAMKLQIEAAWWQHLLTYGRGEQARPILVDAARQLATRLPTTDSPEERARRLEAAILLQAAASQAPANPTLQGLVADLNDRLAEPLKFRGRLAAATRNAARRAQELEKLALDAFARTSLAASESRHVIHLSPSGLDTNPGTKLRPVATLQRAFDIAKQQRRNSGDREITIEVAHGDFHMKTTAILEKAAGIRVRGQKRSRPMPTDAAPAWAPPSEGDVTRFTGAARLRQSSPVTNPAILSRLPASIRHRVMVCDLRAEGIRDWGHILPRGFGLANPWIDVHADGQPMTLARWPNRGEPLLVIGEVLEGTSRFRYSSRRPDSWELALNPDADDLWASGMWEHEWAARTVKVQKIDRALGALQVEHPRIRKGLEFYFLNILEELDTPGEFYIDRNEGMLYFLPPDQQDNRHAGNAAVEFPIFDGPFVRLTNCSDIVFEDVVFSGCRQDGIHLDACRNVFLQRCELRQLGGAAAIINGGSFCGLVDCDLASIGAAGVRMRGGNRATLQPACHIAHNCRIDDFGRIDRCYAPAFHTEGCGMVMTNNTVSRAPHHAFRLDGNDQYVARNNIFQVVQDFGDQAAIDIYCDATFRGIVIERNFFHDIGAAHVTGGQAAVRLDDSISGVLVTENVFHRASTGPFGAIHVNGGKDNVFARNVFIECGRALSFTPWDRLKFERFVRDRFAAFIDSELYARTYPFMDTMLDENVSRNFVVRNDAINCGEFQRRGDRNLFIGNRWTQVASPTPGPTTDPEVQQWVENATGLTLKPIGVQAEHRRR